MNKIVVYTKENCSYCDMLKSYLNQHKIQYQELDVSDPNIKQQLLETVPNVRTVPQLFVNDYHVGGCRDSIDFFEKGKVA